MKKKKKVQRIYLTELTVSEGIALMNHVLENCRGPEKWFVMDQMVKRDFDRFALLVSTPLKCYRCGTEATHMVIDRHVNDRVMPFALNVYSGKKMLTWDHIVPKSLDGSNHPINGRCACSTCNEHRGNEMTLSELVWAATQNPLLIYKRPPDVKESLKSLVSNVRRQFA